MIGKKINQLATELAPVSTDLTIIGDPISGVSKKITLAQLGAIFSGAVSFYDDLASFPATGDINVIYCAKDTKKLYLWSGSAYVEVFPSQALLDTYQLRSEKGVSNGYASLDSGGKVPISQLPSSIMEYKGTWNAATNTPTLANGTGDTGDVYICNVAGTVNFGAGPITFAVGDYVIYSGTIWQRSSGAVGTVTSVAATITGDAIGITGSPVTTSGTLALAFAGTSAQYINGAGSLTTFPTSLISGTGNVNAIPKFTANTVLGNSVMEDDGNFVSMRGLKLNASAGVGNTLNLQQASAITAAGLGYSTIGAAGSTSIQFYLDQNVTSRTFLFDTSTITSDTARTYSMPNSNGTLALTSDIPSLTGYVPYTGATANVDLGTYTLSAYNLIINHTSGSGVAASITKGGAGEALTVVKSSGSGNAASITGGVTLLDELHLNTDLADAYIASASNWNDAYNLRHNAVTLGTANGLSLSTQVLSLALASGSTTGALSSTDWTTFNNKQSALTNPVTGTGTTNYLPKFTGTSTIGNSIVYDGGSGIGIGTTTIVSKLNILGDADYSNIYLARSTSSNTAQRIAILGRNYAGSDSYGLIGAADVSGANIDVLIGLDGTIGPNRIVFRTASTYGATTTQKMLLDASGNLGLGVTPSAWSASWTAQQFGQAGSLFAFKSGSNYTVLSNNSYAVGGGYQSGDARYINNGLSTAYIQNNSGQHLWMTATSGTAGNAISFTQAMTLDASGNLLLGATSQNGTSSKQYIRQSGDGGFKGLNIVSAATGQFVGSMSIDGSGNLNFAQSYLDGAGSFQGITFTTSGSTALTIASTGAATFSSSVTATKGTFVSNNEALKIQSADTNGAYLTISPSTGSDIGYIGSNFHLTGGGSATDLGIRATANMIFDAGGATERMRITSGGELCVGKTSTAFGTVGHALLPNGQVSHVTDGSTPFFLNRLSADGDIALFYRSSSAVGSISVTTSSTSYNTSSDYRLKTDYKDFSGLDLVSKIKAYDYEWKSDKSRSYGVIAHELQSVINYAVTGVKDGKEMQGVDYSKIVPVLIKAIQELNDKIK